MFHFEQTNSQMPIRGRIRDAPTLMTFTHTSWYPRLLTRQRSTDERCHLAKTVQIRQLRRLAVLGPSNRRSIRESEDRDEVDQSIIPPSQMDHRILPGGCRKRSRQRNSHPTSAAAGGHGEQPRWTSRYRTWSRQSRGRDFHTCCSRQLRQ
jgi:hypothetical protein